LNRRVEVFIKPQAAVDATAADGKPVKTSGTVVFQLVRQPAGWMITEVK
jgi:hypothetical protein